MYFVVFYCFKVLSSAFFLNKKQKDKTSLCSDSGITFREHLRLESTSMFHMVQVADTSQNHLFKNYESGLDGQIPPEKLQMTKEMKRIAQGMDITCSGNVHIGVMNPNLSLLESGIHSQSLSLSCLRWVRPEQNSGDEYLTFW